jgi:hypothetical protein
LVLSGFFHADMDVPRGQVHLHARAVGLEFPVPTFSKPSIAFHPSAETRAGSICGSIRPLKTSFQETNSTVDFTFLFFAGRAVPVRGSARMNSTPPSNLTMKKPRSKARRRQIASLESKLMIASGKFGMLLGFLSFWYTKFALTPQEILRVHDHILEIANGKFSL